MKDRLLSVAKAAGSYGELAIAAMAFGEDHKAYLFARNAAYFGLMFFAEGGHVDQTREV